MRDTWLVKNYEYVIRRSNPGSDSLFTPPYVWINSNTDVAYLLTLSGWTIKHPDKIISTSTGLIRVIDTDISEYVTMQGDTVTIGGVVATW